MPTGGKTSLALDPGCAGRGTSSDTLPPTNGPIDAAAGLRNQSEAVCHPHMDTTRMAHPGATSAGARGSRQLGHRGTPGRTHRKQQHAGLPENADHGRSGRLRLPRAKQQPARQLLILDVGRKREDGGRRAGDDDRAIEVHRRVGATALLTF